jgi:hypothetical protein
MTRRACSPRRLAVLGLIGGSFAFLDAIGALFGVDERQSAPQFLLTFPEMIWEATFGIYLATKVSASSALRQDAGARHTAPPVAAFG